MKCGINSQQYTRHVSNLYIFIKYMPRHQRVCTSQPAIRPKISEHIYLSSTTTTTFYNYIFLGIFFFLSLSICLLSFFQFFCCCWPISIWHRKYVLGCLFVIVVYFPQAFFHFALRGKWKRVCVCVCVLHIRGILQRKCGKLEGEKKTRSMHLNRIFFFLIQLYNKFYLTKKKTFIYCRRSVVCHHYNSRPTMLSLFIYLSQSSIFR